MSSARRIIACFDMQYSLAFGHRNWDAPEARTTTWPFVFNSWGTAKLSDRSSAYNIKGKVYEDRTGRSCRCHEY